MPARRNHKDELNSMGIALGGIWVAVLAISIFSPDMVSGSEQLASCRGRLARGGCGGRAHPRDGHGNRPHPHPVAAAMLAPIAAMVLTLLARGAGEYVGNVLTDDDSQGA